ncbi:hypothetical protein INT80_04545 [Gallibacterium anatis]|uniref:Uncharacterized protein n=1 Tax=Gallibacterium anatis TaxID=750 RepID=A0A930Y4X6_9PAST|nr:hypothetical protein [Gallibacterium anatis]
MLNSETLQHKLLRTARSANGTATNCGSKGIAARINVINLTYHADGIAITLPKTQLQLTAQCLWRMTICINQFSLQQPQIRLTALLPPERTG